MTAEQRKQKILDQLRDNDSVRVSELSKQFSISEVTIRTYLEDLEKKGLLTRVHGGAICTYKPYYSMSNTPKNDIALSLKSDVAQRAAELIEPNDTVMLNAGSTTLLAFRRFPIGYNLNIVTNSIPIALEASGNPNYNVILIGGTIDAKYKFTYGNDAAEQLSHYYADKLILSVDGVDIVNGITTCNHKEAEIDRIMIERSKKCIVTADRTKIARTAFANISGIDAAHHIITNTGADRATIQELRALGTEVVTAAAQYLQCEI